MALLSRFGRAVAHPFDREIPQHAGLYRQVRFAEVGHEKQILSKFRSSNFRAVRRIVDQRAGANDRGRTRTLGAAERSDGDRPRSRWAAGPAYRRSARWTDG